MKSTVVGFDWIASSGSLKLLEINTNVSMTGYSRPEYNFDFDALAQYCSDESLTEVKLHHSNTEYYTTDFKSNTIKSVSDEVFSKLSSSLATHDISASIFLDSNSYPAGLDEIDSGTTLDLRVCANVNSNLDYHAVNKENLLNFVSGIGSGSLMPEVGSDEIASNNAAGIPDFVWKVPTADISTGLAFYESGDNNTTISASNEAVSFVEKYYPPDNNKWGYFVGVIKCIVVLTDDGTVIPISSHRNVGDGRISFRRNTLTDYSNKDLKLKNKLIYAGVCGENTKITLNDGSTKTPLEIHLSSVNESLANDEVKAVKIDSLDLEDANHNTPITRIDSYTSYTGSFNFTTGSNKFLFYSNYSEECVTIDGTVFDSSALIPIKSGETWEITKASDVVVGDVYVSSSMGEGTVGSVDTTSNQELVQKQSAGSGSDSTSYYNSLFCDDKLVLFENKAYTISEPDKASYTGAYSGSDAHKQEMDLLSYNIASGTTYNWSNYSASVAQYTENILTQMVTQFSSSLWEY